MYAREWNYEKNIGLSETAEKVYKDYCKLIQ